MERKKKPGRPGGIYKQEIIDYFNAEGQEEATQAQCARDLRIPKDTINRIFRECQKLSHIVMETKKESQSDPYVGYIYIYRGKLHIRKTDNNFSAHSELMKEIGMLTEREIDVKPFTSLQLADGLDYKLSKSEEDEKLDRIAERMHWGKYNK